MKQKPKQAEPRCEREIQVFLNQDPQLSQGGTIHWRRTGIYRWESSDGRGCATSDGSTVETGRTMNGVNSRLAIR